MTRVTEDPTPAPTSPRIEALRGTLDEDLRAAVRPESFATLDEWWQELIDEIAPTVWKRHSPMQALDAIVLCRE